MSRPMADTTVKRHRRAAGPRGAPQDPRADGGFFAALGRMVPRHPWEVIAVWVIAAVAVDATAPKLPSTTSESSFLPRSYESIRASNLQDQAFPQAGHVTAAAAIIVFARADGGQLTSADEAKVASVATTLNSKHITNILPVTAGPASPNKLAEIAPVAMDNDVPTEGFQE